MSKAPRISIITPSFNQAEYLEECLRSVGEQAGSDVEHIVVDGGSTDGSRQIIKRCAGGLAWWCSESDRGQSHAINKGLARATGDVVGWLNSDDLFLPGALVRVAEAFAADSALAVLSGVRLRREEGKPDIALPMEAPADRLAWLSRPRINQQATFFRMNALRSIGGVEERLRYVMDYEAWLQLVLRLPESAIRIVPWDFAVFRHHAASKTITSQAAFVDEMASVIHGLCAQAGLHEHARIMALGHRITSDLRKMPVGAEEQALIDRMAWRFMLKWHHRVYSRTDLHMMRAWLQLAPPVAFLEHMETERLQSLRDHASPKNWLWFRARRKLEHLFR